MIPADRSWHQIVLDANVNNADFWSYVGKPPDRSRMKQLRLVIDGAYNSPHGTIWLDDLAFTDATERPASLGTVTDAEFLDDLSARTFLYFLDWFNPATGLWQDRSTDSNTYSIASTGYGLTALAIRTKRGWVAPQLAQTMVISTLTSLWNGQSAGTDAVLGAHANGYLGLYFHFLGRDGRRLDANSELSTVDTAILIAGVRVARQAFPENVTITRLADAVSDRVQWPFALHHGDDATNDLFYQAWKPECTSAAGDYSYPAPEAAVSRAFRPATGGRDSRCSTTTIRTRYCSSTHWRSARPPTLCQAQSGTPGTRLRCVRHRPAYSELDRIAVHVLCGAPVHRFQHARRRSPACRIEDPGSRLVAELDRRSRDLDLYATYHSAGHACGKSGNNPTFGPDSWGATAAAGPEDRYHAYGSLPSGSQPESDGTIAPYGAGLAVLSAPARAIAALRQYAATPLWTPRFGLMDAYNLEPSCGERPWYSHDLVGIDEGPMLIAIDDLRTGYVQRLMTIDPWIQTFMREIYPAGAQQTVTGTPGMVGAATRTAVPTVTPTPSVTLAVSATSTPTASATGTSTSTPSPSPMASPSAPSPTLSISSPSAGTVVPIHIWITGVGAQTALQPGTFLQLVVHPHGFAYYVQNLPTVQTDGKWTGDAYVGQQQDHGLLFDLCAVLVNQDLPPGDQLADWPSGQRACVTVQRA